MDNIDILNFLNRIPIPQEIRTTIDKWDCIKFKSFCVSKETITIMKRQTTEWEKIFPSYSSDKGLISKLYKDLNKLNSKKVNKLINGKINLIDSSQKYK
jgi:hypothetical protein